MIGGSDRKNVSIAENGLSDDLYELDVAWDIFLDDYQRKIGLVPSLAYDEEGFFPKGNFSNLNDEFSELKSQNQKIQNHSEKNISSLKEKLQQTIPLFENNIDIMLELYNAFDELSEEEATECRETEKVQSLMSDKSLSAISQNLFNSYCVFVDDFTPDKITSQEEHSEYLAKKNVFLKAAVDELNKNLDIIDGENIGQVDELIDDLIWGENEK